METKEVLIPEIEILIATSLWLWQNEAWPYRFSIAKGRGIDVPMDQSPSNQSPRLGWCPVYKTLLPLDWAGH
jgi:hypothetical protein